MPYDPKAKKLHEFDKCCATKIEKGNSFSNMINKQKKYFKLIDILLTSKIDEKNIEELAKAATCYVDGKKFVKGEQMWPEKEDCHNCICNEGFDNSTISGSPHCRKVECNIDFHHGDDFHRGCIPIYWKKASCCPIEWRCRKI